LFTGSDQNRHGKSWSLGLREIPPEIIKQKYVDENSTWVNINGLDVHMKDEGSGPLLLLLHGVLGSLYDWDGWVDQLKAHYRIVRLDIPGFGLTGPANFDWNEEELTRFFYAALEFMGIDKCYIAGSSLGGYLAWKAVVKRPDVIEKLILVDAAGYPQQIPAPLRFFTTPIVDYFATKVTPRWIFDLSFASLFVDRSRIKPKEIERFYDLLLREGNRDSAREVLAYMFSRKDEYPEEIATIKIPTLIMWGSEDSWVPVSLSELFKKDIPTAEVIIYPGVGHVPMLEIPEISARDAHRFLSGRESRKKETTPID